MSIIVKTGWLNTMCVLNHSRKAISGMMPFQRGQARPHCHSLPRIETAAWSPKLRNFHSEQSVCCRPRI